MIFLSMETYQDMQQKVTRDALYVVMELLQTILFMDERCLIEYIGDFFPSGHKFRYQKKPFDGEEDHDHATRPLRGIEILMQLNGITFKRYGKMKKNSPR